jgi:hypothetical protein
MGQPSVNNSHHERHMRRTIAREAAAERARVLASGHVALPKITVGTTIGSVTVLTP